MGPIGVDGLVPGLGKSGEGSDSSLSGTTSLKRQQRRRTESEGPHQPARGAENSSVEATNSPCRLLWPTVAHSSSRCWYEHSETNQGHTTTHEETIGEWGQEAFVVETRPDCVGH